MDILDVHPQVIHLKVSRNHNLSSFICLVVYDTPHQAKCKIL